MKNWSYHVNEVTMFKDFSHKNLQGVSFKDEDLTYARFQDCDLRGADFTGSNLTSAEFNHVKTGITPANTILIFLIALAVSLLSGYIAALAGNSIQGMLKAKDPNIKLAGIATILITVLFIAYSYWRGVGNAVWRLVFPAIVIAVVIGAVAFVLGKGTGMGVFYLIISVILVVLMFVVGTIARAAAGTLSNIIFLVVALAGGMFGKSIGGGIGAVVMAISCAMISKRALSGAEGFGALRKMARFITRKFGTSFRSTRMVNAEFIQSSLRNCDFSNADVSRAHWNNAKKVNCVSTNG